MSSSIAAKPSETRLTLCLYHPSRGPACSTETLLLVGKKMREVVEKREGSTADGKQEDGEKD